MAVSLGKRKRGTSPHPVKTIANDSESDDDVRARFQKAFEAKFKPLPRDEKKTEDMKSAMDEDEESHRGSSDFDGFSEDDGAIEVVQHAAEQALDPSEQKIEWKKFMSSKPPSSDSKTSQISRKMKSTPAGDEDEAAESANLKNDLALQRLLKESHLLTPSAFSTSTSAASNTNPQGKSRLRALDLRLQDLGAKKEAAVKMPMAHRKGIAAKASGREEKRRKEAAENGIVLERFRGGGQTEDRGTTTGKRRERGIGGPNIGKFRGGTLGLSKKDVRDIERSGGGRGRGGGGRGKRERRGK